MEVGQESRLERQGEEGEAGVEEGEGERTVCEGS